MSDYIGTNEQLCNALSTLSGKAKLSQQDAAVAWGAAERITELEAENDRLRGQVATARVALEPFAFLDFDDTQAAWEALYQDTFRDWIDYNDMDAARAAIRALGAGEA